MNQCLMNFFINILHVGDKVLIRKKIISGGVRTWVPDVGLSSPTYGPMGSNLLYSKSFTIYRKFYSNQ